MQTDTGRRLAELGKDFFVYGLMAGLSRLTGFFLLPIFTRAFSVDQYGTIDIVVTLTALLSIVASLSFPSAVQRYFFTLDTDQDRASLVSTLVVVAAIFGCGLLALGILLSRAISNILLGSPEGAIYIVLGFLAAAFTAISRILQIVLRMERRIVRFNLLSLFYSLSYAGLALFFVFGQGTGLIGVFLASVLAAAIQLFVTILWTHQFFTTKLSLQKLRRSFRYSLPLLPAVMVHWVNEQSNRLVLLTYLGLGSVGIFSAGARLALLIRLPVSIFQQAWGPYGMTVINLPDKERKQFYRQVLNYYSGLFVCLGLVLVSIAPEAFRLMVPPEYYQGYVVIPWIVGAAILHTSGSITVFGALIQEKTIANTIAAWSGAIVNVLLTILLIPQFGLGGAAIGMFAAEFVFTFILWNFTVRWSDLRFDNKAILTTLICYIVTSGLILWIAQTVNSPFISLSLRLAALMGASLVVLYHCVDRQAVDAIRTMIKRTNAVPV
ncbi:MAG: oligosaccharide flippase family protein [Chloroflexota bacterium]